MNNFLDPPIYPRRHFCDAQDSIEELIRNIQAPDALIAMEVGSCMSIVTQPLYDIRLPTGQVRPLSMNWAVIADSGERKSAVHAIVAKPIYEFDQRMKEKYDVQIEHYKAELDFWKSVLSGLKQKLVKLTREDACVKDLKEQMSEHAKAKPAKPRQRRIMRKLTNERAMMEALEGCGESIGFVSDEGQVLVKGGALERVGINNSLWDGAELVMDRSDGVQLHVKDPRMSISFMIQRLVFKQFLGKRGDELRGSGNWARYLIGDPRTTKGTRFISTVNPPYVHLSKFQFRMGELLEEYERRIELGKIERDILEFSEDAIRRWIEMSNEIEYMLRPSQYLHDIDDFASKVLEITSRLAGVMHVFSSQEGKISVDTLQRAFDIVGWHIDEFKRLFSPELAVSEVVINAMKVEDYLYRKVWQANYTYVLQNYAFNFGPIRTKAKFQPALDCLESLGRIQIGVGPRGERYINLHHGYFQAKQFPVLDNF
ncbi:YfjI family protein [Herminiimonas contaminans]|uniref:DUF3987 domain-containing protein n=1 Tax=Herminiimonas contaminans TaxID=1111140 RepID=A0ABS0EUE1_9BURK|nr:YfjI family protein [Herminiimonas contaminans]MBF8178369.1 DUF3987 domain-containing protein [Herminiimonas contaminans]